MKKPKYKEGTEARKNFEDGMQKLFRVPKTTVAKAAPKKKGESSK
jgi:hypothetical protein